MFQLRKSSESHTAFQPQNVANELDESGRLVVIHFAEQVFGNVEFLLLEEVGQLNDFVICYLLPGLDFLQDRILGNQIKNKSF